VGKTFRNDASSSRGAGTGNSSRRGKPSKWELKRQIAEAYKQRHQSQRHTPASEDERDRRERELNDNSGRGSRQ